MEYQERNGHPVIWMVYDGLLTLPFPTQERAVDYFTYVMIDSEKKGAYITDYEQTGDNGERSCVISPKSGRAYVATLTCETMGI